MLNLQCFKSIYFKSLTILCGFFFFFYSGRSQMFKEFCGSWLWILLLSGELHLWHWRHAWNLWTLPAHSSYLQHGGLSLCPSVHYLSVFLSSPVSLCTSVSHLSPGEDFCEEESPVRLSGDRSQGPTHHPSLQHLPEDDRWGLGTNHKCSFPLHLFWLHCLQCVL